MRTDCLQCSSLLVAVCLICFVWFLVILAVLLLLWALACSIRYLVVQARCLFPPTHTLKNQKGRSFSRFLRSSASDLWSFRPFRHTGHDFYTFSNHAHDKKKMHTNISIISSQYSILIKKNIVYYTLRNTSLRMIYLQTPQFTPQIPKNPPPHPHHHATTTKHPTKSACGLRLRARISNCFCWNMGCHCVSNHRPLASATSASWAVDMENPCFF